MGDAISEQVDLCCISNWVSQGKSSQQTFFLHAVYFSACFQIPLPFQLHVLFIFLIFLKSKLVLRV